MKKKIKKTSERASDRVGPPVHRDGPQVKKKKHLTNINMGLYKSNNKGARNENKRSKNNYRFINKNLKNAWPVLQLASVGMQNRQQAAES